MEKENKENKECRNIDELKIEYEKLREKYNLPDFSDLNELFDIEEINTETEFLLRGIRRIIADKVASYLRFIEVILNPSNSPFFFFKLIKKLDSHDREVLSNLYEELGKVEVEIIALDLDYSEENEAEFVRDIFQAFNTNIKSELLRITRKLTEKGENNKKETNGSYFG